MKTLETIIADTFIRHAKDKLWDSISKKQQKELLATAEKEYWAKITADTLKDIDKMNKVMDDPKYVSRADPNVYLPKKAKKHK